MNKVSLISICAIILLLSSCLKEDNRSYGDPEIQYFWVFEGFYNISGELVNAPTFDPDTMFAYEVNIVFLWNYGRQLYEIQGQGPQDIFWGEYRANEQKLTLTSFLTTGITDTSAAGEYERIFFQALKDASSYSFDEGGNLIINLKGDEGITMRFKKREKQYSLVSGYVKAEIDSMEWSADMGNFRAYIIYDEEISRSVLDFGGSSYTFLDDDMQYLISFNIQKPIARGKYHFNNDGLEFDIDGGVMARCNSRSEYNEVVETRSTEGVVAITLLNRTFIEGYFHFESKSVADTIDVEHTIESGEFLIGLTVEPGWFKSYSFN